MARICLDINAITRIKENKDWWGNLRSFIDGAQRVIIVIGDGKYKKEISKVKYAVDWINELSRAGRVKSVAFCETEKFISKIFVECPVSNCTECNDLHHFAICTIGEASYLFTNEIELCKCRRKIQNLEAGKKYCRFKIIRSEKTFKYHKGFIRG